MPSLFTKIINRELSGEIVYEDDEMIALRDKYPAAPVHLLIIPKREIRTLDDLGDEDAPLVGRMILRAKKLAAELGLANGYRLVLNCNDHGGQSVYHIHLHLLGGRPMRWPPG